jgi:hypothetical protein
MANMNANDYDPFMDDAPDAGDVANTNDAVIESMPSAPSLEAMRTAELALNLRDNAAAGWLYLITNSTLGEKIGPDAFLVFRKLMLEEAGNPTDPIERMLIEQLALAHFSIGQLRIRSCTTDMPKMSLAFSDSATRLLGEFRRCSLALEEYRSKRAARTEKRDSTTGEKAVTLDRVNGHAHPSFNGNGKHVHTELKSNGSKEYRDSEPGSNGTRKLRDSEHVPNFNGELPPWVKRRMAYPTPKGSPPVEEIASNGKG